MFQVSPELQIDGYKVGHHDQYPPGLEMLYSNLTPRSLKYLKTSKGHDGKVVVLGLQAFIQDYLLDDWNANFFGRYIGDVLEEYQIMMDEYLGKGAVTTDHIRDLHELGYMPLLIKGMPEGSRIPTKIPYLTIRNTDPRFGWLVNYLETILSEYLWAITTIATIAHEFRRVMTKYALMTGTALESVLFQGHDFAMRGVTDIKGAIGHLVNFLGTDTVPAIQFIKRFYGAKGPIGLSVPASEHSVSACNIAMEESKLMLESNDAEDSKYLAELAFFQRFISEIYPSGICSYVSDTYDFFRVITDIAAESKDLILARKPNALGLAKVVFRPDSGHPVKIICGEWIPQFADLQEAEDTLTDIAMEEASESCEGSHCMGMDTYTKLAQVGDSYYEFKISIEYNRHDKRYYYVDGASCSQPTKVILTPEQKGAVRCLWETFGGTITSTGHKRLHERVGLIYGDSITLEIAEQIMENLANMGFASDSVVDGIGSFTYNMISRDTLGIAMKATYAVVNGKGLELYKDPKTDNGMKKSARGLLRVERVGDTFVLHDRQTWGQEDQGELRLFFQDGEVFNREDWDTIKKRLWG